MKIATERIGGAEIDIDVSGEGRFSATFNDQEFSGKTLEELRERLKAAVKKAAAQGTVPVSVLGLVPAQKKSFGFDDGPFTRGAGIVDAKLRSKHEREYNSYLLVSDSGQKFKVAGSSREPLIARRLTLAEHMEYLKLAEAVRVATTALEDFVGSVKINPDEALAAARKKGAA